MNQAGFYFGSDASVSAAGLVVSTAPLARVDSGYGPFWQFSGPPPQAAIANYGRINAGSGGSLFLFGEHIENHGSLEAPRFKHGARGGDVHATGVIRLQEVRNPNGILNDLGSTTSPWRHFFDYSPEAYTVLSAGHAVQLLGTDLPLKSLDVRAFLANGFPDLEPDGEPRTTWQRSWTLLRSTRS